MYRSLWQYVPLDLLHLQVFYLEDPNDILKFCEDGYVKEKLCKNDNSHIWYELYYHNFSDWISLEKGETIMSQYLKDKKILFTKNFDVNDCPCGFIFQKWEPDLNVKLFYFLSKRGYDKLLSKLDASKIFNEELYNAFLLASKYGHLHLVEYLANMGAKDLPAVWCAQVEAARMGHLSVVKYLCENEIFCSASNAMVAALEEGHLSVIKYLHNFELQRGSKYSFVSGEQILTYGILKNSIEMIEYGIENGANINNPIFGQLPIIKAIVSGNLQIVQFLVEKGANLCLKDDCPLRCAEMHKNIPIIKYLISKGANINVLKTETLKLKL